MVLALNITVEDDLEQCIVLDCEQRRLRFNFCTNLPVAVELRRRLFRPILTSRLVLVQLSDNVYNEGVPLRNSLDLDVLPFMRLNIQPYLPRLNHIREEIGVEFQVAHISGADTELLIAANCRAAKFLMPST